MPQGLCPMTAHVSETSEVKFGYISSAFQATSVPLLPKVDILKSNKNLNMMSWKSGLQYLLIVEWAMVCRFWLLCSVHFSNKSVVFLSFLINVPPTQAGVIRNVNVFLLLSINLHDVLIQEKRLFKSLHKECLGPQYLIKWRIWMWPCSHSPWISHLPNLDTVEFLEAIWGLDLEWFLLGKPRDSACLASAAVVVWGVRHSSHGLDILTVFIAGGGELEEQRHRHSEGRSILCVVAQLALFWLLDFMAFQVTPYHVGWPGSPLSGPW